MDFRKELQEILEKDPLGLLDVKPKSSGVMTTDERLVASFQEINDFIKAKGREPEASRDVHERRLFSRLKAIRESIAKAEALRSFDQFGLLESVKPVDLESIQTVDDILARDALGLLDEEGVGDSEESIFNLRNVPKSPQMPDFIAKRKPCAEFAQFEPLFVANHAALAARTMVTRPFSSERQIKPGEFFILQGMMVYVANQGDWEKKNFGNFNARLYCVFENGTESNLFLRSLAAALWKDSASRQLVDANQYELFKQQPIVAKGDEATGYIYILKSLSNDPQITSIRDLYKVGFSSNKVEVRTQGAKKDATYLFQDVRPVAEFQTFNLNPQKLELLLHKFLGEACLNVDVFDAAGRRYSPREWFVAPLHVICQAIEFIISGEITQFQYDPSLKEIVRRPDARQSDEVAAE